MAFRSATRPAWGTRKTVMTLMALYQVPLIATCQQRRVSPKQFAPTSKEPLYCMGSDQRDLVSVRHYLNAKTDSGLKTR